MELQLIAAKLLSLADSFRSMNCDSDDLTFYANAEETGRLISRAFELGSLQSIDGLRALVEWVKNPPERLPTVGAVISPCYANLFWEFAGLNGIGVTRSGDRLEIIRGHHGGVLPDLFPKTLTDQPVRWDRKSKCEHYATVCRWLATQLNGSPESDDEGNWVPASKCAAEHDIKQSKIKAFCDRNGIRTRKPSAQRLQVHAGDWMKHWIRHRAEQEQMQVAGAEMIARMQQTQAQKRRV
jgi:hypothetical protein